MILAASPALRNARTARPVAGPLIRHYWEGKISCAQPQYGRWGGPPGTSDGGKPQVAADLANAPRGRVKLLEVVQSKLPSFGLPGIARKLRPGEQPPAAPARK